LLGVFSRQPIDLRGVLNAMRYMVRSDREWRMLPVHFPPWQTVIDGSAVSSGCRCSSSSMRGWQ
jgi:transposase